MIVVKKKRKTVNPQYVRETNNGTENKKLILFNESGVCLIGKL